MSFRGDKQLLWALMAAYTWLLWESNGTLALTGLGLSNAWWLNRVSRGEGYNIAWECKHDTASEVNLIKSKCYLETRLATWIVKGILFTKKMNIYSLSGHPRCRWVCFFIRKDLNNFALHHLRNSGSSAVNGCRKNESKQLVKTPQ